MAEWKRIRGNTGALLLKGTCIMTYETAKGKWILFDSGSHHDREDLFSWLEEHEISVEAVFTSHVHYDHEENHSCLKERYGASLIASAMDAELVKDSISLKACFYSCTKSEIERYFGEMIFQADQIIQPGQTQILWNGIPFEILNLPGHAVSHIGYATPDQVCYLADALLDTGIYEKERLVYTLDWGSSLQTMKLIGHLPFKTCVLAHYGITEDSARLASENQRAFFHMLSSIQALFPAEFTLEEITKQVISGLKIPVKSYPKSRVIERSMRSVLEYLTEENKIQTVVRDGMIIYQRQK